MPAAHSMSFGFGDMITTALLHGIRQRESKSVPSQTKATTPDRVQHAARRRRQAESRKAGAKKSVDVKYRVNRRGEGAAEKVQLRTAAEREGQLSDRSPQLPSGPAE